MKKMRILAAGEELPKNVTSVVSIGNFDGIHRGHQKLIHEVLERAEKNGCCSVIITFQPHTRQVLNPEITLPLLTIFEEKAMILEKMGIDYLLCIPFSLEYSRYSPEYFIENILCKSLHCVELVMGEGHGIGNGRISNKNVLHKVLCKYHIIPFTVNLSMLSDKIISSTQIRVDIIQGRIRESIEMLGHPYPIAAIRVSGLKLGTQLGFPTLNFSKPSSKKTVPPQGVYAAELEYRGKMWFGALYFGMCPTFTDRITHFEFYSFQFDTCFPDIGEECILWLHAFIRSDKKFSSKEDLTKQIGKDVKMIQQFFIEEKQDAFNKRA